MGDATISKVSVSPFEGQKPGTSGLRKKVSVFKQPHYTECFIQCTLNAIPSKDLEGCHLMLGGDGRYLSKEVIQVIINVCAANGVGRLTIGQSGIFSTPAVSALIRSMKCQGGIILTASHNPGGPEGDFGIKFNIENGGPAPESFTNKVFELTKTIDHYLICKDITPIDINCVGSTYNIGISGKSSGITIDIIDSCHNYVSLMKTVFDFDALKSLLSKPSFKIRVDCMNGVMGPYAKKILIDELGASSDNVVNAVPLMDFGGLHPDPNLTYARPLVDAMKCGEHIIGFAFDGDGDRNMIIGRDGLFVCPCDSLAVIAHHADQIPYFRKGGVKGLARSMPTGAAIDLVAKAKNLTINEVPTVFGNLMDAGKLSICGEESFGTGSDHIREKDGLWAALCWLQIIASLSKEEAVEVKTILVDFWKIYGRNFFTRYDYENVDSDAATKMMTQMREKIDSGELVDKTFEDGNSTFKISKCDDFCYTDPIDASVSKNQGLRVIMSDGSRFVFRLSGTGSSGATIRLYVESYEPSSGNVSGDAQEMLRPLVNIALKFSELEKFTSRTAPTVIT